uniref:Uncharacterized protein n=1 Tax=Cucumis melo TaxID=3656 RepID=A0A9I9EI01_CUCME
MILLLMVTYNWTLVYDVASQDQIKVQRKITQNCIRIKRLKDGRLVTRTYHYKMKYERTLRGH